MITVEEIAKERSTDIFDVYVENFTAEISHIISYPLGKFKNSQSPPECNVVKFSPHDKLIACGFSNGNVNIYDPLTGATKRKFNSHENPVTGLRWKPHPDDDPKNILLTINSNGDISFWHSSTGKLLHEMNEPDTSLFCLDYSKDGDIFAIGDTNNEVKIYNDDMKIMVHKYDYGTSFSPGHLDRVNSVCFHKNDSTGNFSHVLVSGGCDQRVLIHDIRDCSICGTISGPLIFGDSLDLKDNYLLTGSYSISDFVQIWDLRTLKKIETLDSGNLDAKIYAAQFIKNSDKNLFAIGTYRSHSLKIYNMNYSESYLCASTSMLASACYAIDFSNKGGVLSFGCADGAIRIISL